MMAISVDRFRGRALVAWIACAALASWACANAPSTTLPAPTPMQLSEVQVESASGGTVVSLVGPVDPVYTAFQQEDPPRVVVDLVGVAARTATEEVAVYDGNVEEVAVTPFSLGTGEDRTRIELTLVEPVEYDVVVLEDRLEIRIAPEGSEIAGVETPTEETEGVWDSEETQEVWTDPVLADATADAASNPADALLQVAADAGDPQVHLLANGAILETDHFLLENPTRLVVDLPGMVSRAPSGAIDVGSEQVARVRIGQHADKVRVVLDAGEGFDFDGVALSPTFDGLVVSFDGTGPAPTFEETVAQTPETPGEELAGNETEPEPVLEAHAETPVTETAWAEPEADGGWTDDAIQPEPEATVEAVEEPVHEEIQEIVEAAPVVETPEIAQPEAVVPAEPEPTFTEVYGLQFDRSGALERLVVLTDGIASYHVNEIAPDTLMVQIHGAIIDPEAAVRIAPEPAGSVGLVTAFQQPEMDDPEVRIVVRRAPGVTPDVSQRGTMLFLDFPKSEGLAAELPMFEEPATPAAAAPSTGASKAVAQAVAETVPAPEPVPAAIDALESVDILEEGGLIDGKTYTGRRISLDFKDVEITDVLRLIAEVSDLNIIAGDEVTGEVTIRLVDVPWDQALDVILLTKGLGFVRVGNVLRIAPSDLLKAEEEARLQERRAKEKLEDLVVKLQPVNYANVDEVSKMVTRLLTPRGTVDVDKRTNTLILKDIGSVIDEATALIKAIDTQTPQVLIEAKIVEANLDFSRELGSTWAFGTQPLVDGFNPQSGDREDLGSADFALHDNPLLLPGITDTFNHVTVNNPITSVANGLLDLGAFLLDEKFNVELRLEAAESSGEGKVISSPRVVTLDNRKAMIEQGVSIPFQTFENGDAKLEFIDAVLKLEVTPHITADRSIIMQIEVQRNAPDDSVPTPTGSPAIAKNQAETETLVKDGQTLVIGGIYVVRKSERGSRVPYFHKIPLIGNAFKNTEVRDIRQELLVFVTPRIVVNPELAS